VASDLVVPRKRQGSWPKWIWSPPRIAVPGRSVDRFSFDEREGEARQQIPPAAQRARVGTTVRATEHCLCRDRKGGPFQSAPLRLVPSTCWGLRQTRRKTEAVQPSTGVRSIHCYTHGKSVTLRDQSECFRANRSVLVGRGMLSRSTVTAIIIFLRSFSGPNSCDEIS
jgi:hypothetical protein